jgi:hypothetical protein
METDEDLFDEMEDEGSWELVEQENPDETHIDEVDGSSTVETEEQFDGSHKSSLGYININPPDWGSVVSELEDDGTTVGIFAADNDKTLSAPICVRGQKGARPDMTGGSTNTEHLSPTDEEAESPKLGQVVQVVAGDSIKTLATTPV